MTTVLVVDDMPGTVRALLREMGHEVLTPEGEGLKLIEPCTLLQQLPDSSRTKAFLADRNDWRNSRRARGRKS